MTRRRVVVGAIALIALLALVAVAAAVSSLRQRVNFSGMLGGGDAVTLSLPAGFRAEVFASGLDGPRFIAVHPNGGLMVAERGANRVVLLRSAGAVGEPERIEFAADLPSPHSIVEHDGSWYVGVPSGVIRLTDVDDDGRADERQTLIDDYPTGGHSTRTVQFLPDGRMVVSVGSSCNVCQESDWRRAAIVVYSPEALDGGRLFASGLRNAVGLAIQPSTGELWASNNGRDLMGDDLPPDTIERVASGGDHGWPRCHSGRIPDPDFGGQQACAGVTPPQVELQAHSAPLGLVFYDGEQFPPTYHGDLFVAYHGSWNRSELTGYKVVHVDFEGGRPAAPPQDFATGWLDSDGETVYGRPVGLAVGADGSLYVSDDKAGTIYRIHYTGN